LDSVACFFFVLCLVLTLFGAVLGRTWNQNDLKKKINFIVTQFTGYFNNRLKNLSTVNVNNVSIRPNLLQTLQLTFRLRW
jgi:hypothetical protein